MRTESSSAAHSCIPTSLRSCLLRPGLCERNHRPDPSDSWVHFDDGRRLGFENAAEHWRAARLLLDQVGPGICSAQRQTSSSSGRDSPVGYRVTTVYQQRIQQYEGGHLERALALFPEDAELHFFNGCLHVRSVVYPAPAQDCISA